MVLYVLEHSKQNNGLMSLIGCDLGRQTSQKDRSKCAVPIPVAAIAGDTGTEVKRERYRQ